MEILKAVYCSIYSDETYLLDFNAFFLDNIKKIYGTECFDPKTNKILIPHNKCNGTFNCDIELDYPNIFEVLNPSKIDKIKLKNDIINSSYLVK